MKYSSHRKSGANKMQGGGVQRRGSGKQGGAKPAKGRVRNGKGTNASARLHRSKAQ